MNSENKAIREIQESVILVDYLIYHNLDFDNPKYFSAKYVKKALEWKQHSKVED